MANLKQDVPTFDATEEYSQLQWDEMIKLQMENWPRWRIWTHQLKIECAFTHPRIAPELIDVITVMERSMSGHPGRGKRPPAKYVAIVQAMIKENGLTL